MLKLYLNKIMNGEINTQTQEVWGVKDVPLLWRAQVQEALNEQPPN